MPDHFIEDDYGPDTRPAQGTYFDVVLVTIILLTTTFSAYTTYKGFSFDIPPFLAAFLCVVIGLSLLAINLKIRDARRLGLALGGPILAFFVVFVFSFISNTNAIYTFFVQRDIVGQTQEVAWKVFDSQTNKITSAIAELPEVIVYEDRDTKLQIARRNLKQQITDARNPGFGDLAQEHYAEVKRILGVNLTPLRAPIYTAPMPQHEQYANELDALIVNQAKSQFGNDSAIPIIDLRNRIKVGREFYEKQLIAKKYDSNTTDLMNRDLNSFHTTASELFNPDIEVVEIDIDSDATGSFQYTWRNFLHWISPAAIILSVLLGALLDLLAPLLSILLYRYEEVI